MIYQKVAEILELDLSDGFALDRVSNEMNAAVLHSFSRAGVTMVDHHAQSEQFMDFFRQEHRDRGGCPADWVWICPPVAGSLTEVFHQEMLNYLPAPCYNYQASITFITRGGIAKIYN